MAKLHNISYSDRINMFSMSLSHMSNGVITSIISNRIIPLIDFNSPYRINMVASIDELKRKASNQYEPKIKRQVKFSNSFNIKLDRNGLNKIVMVIVEVRDSRMGQNKFPYQEVNLYVPQH